MLVVLEPICGRVQAQAVWRSTQRTLTNTVGVFCLRVRFCDMLITAYNLVSFARGRKPLRARLSLEVSFRRSLVLEDNELPFCLRVRGYNWRRLYAKSEERIKSKGGGYS